MKQMMILIMMTNGDTGINDGAGDDG